MLQPQQLIEEPLRISAASASASAIAIAIAIMDEPILYIDDYDIDSTCSTPYVSAPSSPGRGGHCGPAPTSISGFYYSAPASPMHFMLSSSSSSGKYPIPEAYPASSSGGASSSFEFDFSSSKASANGSGSGGSMSSADELFLNGQIRPMKLSTHLQRPQVLAPLLDLDESAAEDDDELPAGDGVVSRGRDVKIRDRTLRRRTRSMSPLRTTASFGWAVEDFEVNIRDVSDSAENGKNGKEGEDYRANAAAASSTETTPCESGASSRSSSVGRSSSRWVFLKEFLYRSKSEGRNTGHKFWGSLTFSPVKDKIKMDKFMPSSKTAQLSSKEKNTASVLPDLSVSESSKTPKQSSGGNTAAGTKEVKKKAVNWVGKRRVPPSPHELHYTANRAQAEEMRKKTFLPYRQGLLGCLGFSSRSYGAMNGFARALNPVYSR